MPELRRSLLSLGGPPGWIALALGAAGVVAASVLLLARSAEPMPSRITFTAGFNHETRALVAKALVEELARSGLPAEIVDAGATADELARVEAGTVDFALVSGAFHLSPYAHVRVVAPLYPEALHLMVKAELAGPVATSLAALRGRRVLLGPDGSTTASLAEGVLDFTLLLDERDGLPPVRAERMGMPELEALLQRGDRDALPDAVFDLATAPSLIALRLVHEMDYRLVAIPFAQAFRLANILGPGPGRADEALIDRALSLEVTIPAFTYATDPPVPPAPVVTLGTRLVLVANQAVAPGIVERVLDTLYGTHFALLVEPPLDRSILRLVPHRRRHSGTSRFLARGEPLLDANDVDKLSNTLSVLGAVVGGGVFFWQGLRQRRQAQRDRLFAEHMRRVAGIERRIVALELSAQLDLEALSALQRELLEMKADALARFSSGELDHHMLSDLMTPVDAARDNVGSLLLHLRENLERRAEEESRSVDAVWNEAADASELERSQPVGDRPPR
ncbi:MAG TPA: hypothetical protein VFC77_05355 [Myxococcota bacterium]|nr:hypothetical protein [Myxococcota bacterium]